MSFKLTKQLAVQLGETHHGPIAQIRRVIEHAGAEMATTAADDAIRMVAAGEMLRADGSPRTPGGIFFALVRQRVDRALIPTIFPSAAAVRRAREARGEAPLPPRPQTAPEAAPGPTLPAFRWDDKAAIYRELAAEKGTVQSMKVTLIGRPGRVVEKQDLVITMMTQMDPPKSFPKGVPAPPATPTVYTVYIGAKQWKNVAEAMQNPEDRLIIEGFAAFDPGLEGMAVFVTNTTTKLLQQQKRQPA